MEHWNPSATTPRAGIGPAAAPLQPSPPSALGPATEPAPLTAPGTALVPMRHDGWTPARQATFLRVLAATGNVSAAAREAGMTRQSAYKLRARLAGEPFDHAWQAAFATGYDRLAEAAMERALNGTEVPHYHKGELVGTHRRFDERLTLGLLHLRAGAPAHRPRLPTPALGYVGDLTAMIDRVAEGPETWAEEQRAIAAREEAEALARADEFDEDEWDEWEGDDWDDDDWEEDDGDELGATKPYRLTPEELEAAIIAHKRRIGVLPWEDEADGEEE